MEKSFYLLHTLITLITCMAPAVAFTGVWSTRKNKISLGIFLVLDVALQIAIVLSSGSAHMVQMIYPLIAYIPLILMITFVTRCPIKISIPAVLSACFCGLIPEWTSALYVRDLESMTGIIGGLIYLLVNALYIYIVVKLAGRPVRIMLQQQGSVNLVFSIIPLVFIIFIYVETGNSTWLTDPDYRTSILLLAMVSFLYITLAAVCGRVFVRSLGEEHEKNMLLSTLEQSQKNFDNIKKMQHAAAEYRHNMRHFVRVLSTYASEGQIDKIKEFLSETDRDIDNITPRRFSENETVNLLFSYYEDLAKEKQIRFEADAELPKYIPIDDMDFLVLVGNALENAFNAAERFEGKDRYVNAKMFIRYSNLLLSTENRTDKKLVLQDGIPVTKEEGHGYGTYSIQSIAKKYGGHAVFSESHGIFTLKVALPASGKNESGPIRSAVFLDESEEDSHENEE